MAKHFYGSRLLISEHGIYTREREEELIKAKWVEGIYKKYLDRSVSKNVKAGVQRRDAHYITV